MFTKIKLTSTLKPDLAKQIEQAAGRATHLIADMACATNPLNGEQASWLAVVSNAWRGVYKVLAASRAARAPKLAPSHVLTIVLDTKDAPALILSAQLAHDPTSRAESAEAAATILDALMSQIVTYAEHEIRGWQNA